METRLRTLLKILGFEERRGYRLEVFELLLDTP
jgi:hypothetical protein